MVENLATIEEWGLSGFIMDVLHAVRVELVFLAVFALIYLAGRAATFPARQPKPSRAGAKASETSHSCARDGTSALTALLGAKLDRARLNDVTYIAPQILQLCRGSAMKGFELLKASRAAGLDLTKLPDEEYQQLMSVLMPALLRFGHVKELMELVSVMRLAGKQVTAAWLTSLMKLATSRRMFTEALDIYDFVTEDPSFEASDKSVFSCLIYCCIEVQGKQHIHRCRQFFEQLKAMGEPAEKDYGNMVRYGSTTGDWQLCLQMLEESKAAAVSIDAFVYNMALAACVSAEQLDVAKALLEAMDSSTASLADVVTYNTMAKGYVKMGRMQSCLEVFELMLSRNIAASQVTYGIILDGFINDGQAEKAAEIFEIMKRKGCQMNTVLCTTLIKGFARNGQVDASMQIYRQMLSEPGPKPDLITYSVLIKANCDAGKMEQALKLLKDMQDRNQRPDEVIYNNLIAGCVKEGSAALGQKMYKEMLTVCKPSNATFSLMIQLHVACKMIDVAVHFLRKLPEQLPTVPLESRIYIQLLVSCLRQRQGSSAKQVHEMMLHQGITTEKVHKTVLQMCSRLHMLETGVELLGAAVQARAPVDEADAQELLEAMKKPSCGHLAEACRSYLQLLRAGKHRTVSSSGG